MQEQAQTIGGHGALVGPTAGDVRDVMVDAESGVLGCATGYFRPKYEPSKRRLTWPNGTTASLYSADEPERLRGPSHHWAWADEVAAWRYPEAWDMLMFTLRAGDNPRCVATTTPKPIKILRDLLDLPTTVVVKGSSYENEANLAPAFFEKIVSRYEGTRLGRQELHAELLDDVPGALWTRDMILRADATWRDMLRVVVAVDPEATSTEESSETGIVVAGKGHDGRGYVLADLTLRGRPDEWAREAIRAYELHHADRVVAEINQGGEMVEAVLRTVDLNVPYKGVHASRGKVARAEPVAALYEQGRVYHCGVFELLEDQMCTYVPGEKSPDRMDALVWALTELQIEEPGYETVVTDSGWNPYGQGF